MLFISSSCLQLTLKREHVYGSILCTIFVLHSDTYTHVILPEKMKHLVANFLWKERICGERWIRNYVNILLGSVNYRDQTFMAVYGICR